MVYSNPVGPEPFTVMLSIKKHCVSYEGSGGLGVYEWLEVAELYGVSKKMDQT